MHRKSITDTTILDRRSDTGWTCDGVGREARRKVPPFVLYEEGRRRSMKTWEKYHLARSIQEALTTLAGAPGPARPIAGGTDLLLDLQQGRHPPVHTLVDITSIPELNALEIRQDELFVGAAVPLNRVVASPLVQEHAWALFEAASLIGGPQVRNTATLGGNVGHALPAADGAIALLSLGAQAEVADLNGCRRVPFVELFKGPGLSALDQRSELLVGFALPLRRKGQASAFRRVMRPQGVAIAILNMGVWLQREGDRVADIRLAAGPAGPHPFRARAAEAALRGQVLNDGTLDAAMEAFLSEARFRTSAHRSTAEYRHHLTGVLLSETLRTAWERSFE